jgi:hypothetical protein
MSIQRIVVVAACFSVACSRRAKSGGECECLTQRCGRHKRLSGRAPSRGSRYSDPKKGYVMTYIRVLTATRRKERP